MDYVKPAVCFLNVSLILQHFLPLSRFYPQTHPQVELRGSRA